MQNKKIIIVGAGIVGIAISCKLVLRGYDVTIIDRDEPARGASFGNAGHIATEQIFPLASPQILKKIPAMLWDPQGPLVVKPEYYLKFLPWALRFLWASRPSAFEQGILATKSLNGLSMRHWQDLLTALGLSSMLKTKGSLEIFQTEKAFLKSADLLRNWREYEIQVETMRDGEVKEKVPDLKGRIAGALYFPHTGHVLSPYGLAKNMLSRAVERGLRLVRDNITEIKTSGGHWLRGEHGEYRCDGLILATGAFSKALLNSTGKNIPMEAERGYHYQLPKPNIHVEQPISFHERKFILSPLDGGIRLSGTVEFSGLSSPATRNRAKNLFSYAKAAFPDLKDEQAGQWTGCRPTLPDYLPVIDQENRIIHAYGHNHLGLTQAAVTASLVQHLIEETTPPIPLSPFRSGRF